MFITLKTALPLLFSLLLVYQSVQTSRDYGFDQSGISREVLENYLSRSVTMAEFLAVDPYNNNGTYPNKEDDVRLIDNIGAKFIGRAIYRWGKEDTFNHPEFLAEAKKLVRQVHANDEDVIFQAALFEMISPKVNQIKVPAWVFEEFDLPVENRTFRYESMLNPEGKMVNHWGRSGSVPDITQTETQLWLMFLAGTYMNIGCEALHLGQIALIGMADPELHHWSEFLTKIRAFARKHARRGWVLLDAHTPSGGMVVDGTSLLDFNTFPMRIKEIPDKPQEAELEVGHLDALYGRSLGCTTPSGWTCVSLPYLVEFDNFGCSRNPGIADTSSHFVWGYDEISWFYLQDEEYRQEWLKYAWHWVREHDENGYLQMPVSRIVSVCDGTPIIKNRANTRTEDFPDGLNLEKTIKAIWDE